MTESFTEKSKETQAKWPDLNYHQWKSTCETLHRWIQIVGKIRLSKSPWVNHGWQTTLYVMERGLTTSVIHDDNISFSIEFDFEAHELRIPRNNGNVLSFPLRSESVAVFYQRCISVLLEAGIDVKIFDHPNELGDALPFSKDEIHCTYDPLYANRFWCILLQADRLMKIFRSRYIGKVSPVHFFWGSMDIAVSRFSGRRAPVHPGGIPHLPDVITQEAYSHEVSSCGFWPGNESFPTPAFYSYAYPKPDGFERCSVPEGAFYHETLGEFILPYEIVKNASNPDNLVFEFFQKTYEAAAESGRWPRDILENSTCLEILQKKSHCKSW
ncbi:MAG: DUF5996 family protein [Candidatus Berkiellales bacterium]